MNISESNNNKKMLNFIRLLFCEMKNVLRQMYIITYNCGHWF